MRKPPIPRAVPHRPPREHWATVGACGVLALGHATRAAVDSHHVAYLSILDLLGVAAAIGVGIQIALVDDGVSRVLAAGVAALLGAASIVSVTIGFPGAAPAGFGLVPLVTLAASAYVLGASLVTHLVRRRTERGHAPARHPRRLRDRDTFEHGGSHTALCELREKRHGLEEHAEALHARLLDDGPERAREPRGDHGEHRSCGDRGAVDHAVSHAPVRPVALTPYLDSGGSPFPLVAEPAAETRTARRLSQLHREPGDVGKGVDEQAASSR